MSRSLLVFLLCMIGTQGRTVAQTQIDTDHSSLTIHVEKTGLLSAAGHEHTVTAPISAGAISEGPRPTFSFRVAAANLVVLPEDHQAEIQRSMQKRALESSRFPEITFTSQSIDLVGENRWTVVGMLMLHGQARSLNIPVRKVDGRYIGTTTIKQTDFGIHPISAAGGTVKVKNELRIDFSIATK